MNCYQLRCGHWQGEALSREIGGFMHCNECNALRVLIIGMTGAPQFAATESVMR